MCSFVRFEKNVGGWRGWFDDAREYHAQVKRGLQNLYLLQHVEETLQPAPGKTLWKQKPVRTSYSSPSPVERAHRPDSPFQKSASEGISVQPGAAYSRYVRGSLGQRGEAMSEIIEVGDWPQG
ncbi:hypothetical protein OOU_Y34scaffold00810g2 [Pyricularia oryzae Y34]|uniref:Uncharacterized protein n=2 Tax=Pyricularia oryzae TaxID=318829 RepID=A0AA97NPS4_PYRO3|nr:hypothetical protein OOU_Y34scaffold00810g2 [Pyricularia oryzae Y34]